MSSDPFDTLKGWIPLASLQPTHVGTVYADKFGKSFLAQPTRHPKVAQVLPKRSLQVAVSHLARVLGRHLRVHRLISSAVARREPITVAG